MAAEIHNQMISTKDTLEQTLLNLKKDTSGLVSQDSILAWEELLKIWENDLVEVPGNELHHDHHQSESNPHHSHQQLDVTPEQMLEVQKELQQRLTAIEKRIAPSAKN